MHRDSIISIRDRKYIFEAMATPWVMALLAFYRSTRARGDVQLQKWFGKYFVSYRRTSRRELLINESEANWRLSVLMPDANGATNCCLQGFNSVSAEFFRLLRGKTPLVWKIFRSSAVSNRFCYEYWVSRSFYLFLNTWGFGNSSWTFGVGICCKPSQNMPNLWPGISSKTGFSVWPIWPFKYRE